MPVPFDTHAVIQELSAMGFSQRQAEGLSTVLAQVVASQEYATKADLTEATLRLDVKLEAIKSDITTLKWGMAVLIGGVVSLVLKAFVHL